MTNNLIVFKRHEILKQIGSEQELKWLQCLSWNRKHGNEASKKKKKVANYSEYLLPHVNGNHKKVQESRIYFSQHYSILFDCRDRYLPWEFPLHKLYRQTLATKWFWFFTLHSVIESDQIRANNFNICVWHIFSSQVQLDNSQFQGYQGE